jgi:transposase
MLDGGASVTEVADAYGRTTRCIRDLRKKYTTTGTTEDKPRTGRPPILPLSQKKIIYRKARATSKIEYSDLAKEAVYVNAEGTPSKPPSRSTLYRVLKRRSLTNYRCKKRPKLTAKHARERYLFSQFWRRFRWASAQVQ